MQTIDIADKNTHPPVGAIVYDQEGVPYQVTRRWRDKTTDTYWVDVTTSEGVRKVELGRVTRWDMPTPAEKSNAPYEKKLKVGDRVVIKNLTDCLRRYPRMSVDVQCAKYQVEQVNEGGTATIASDYGRVIVPIAWLGVLT